MRPRAARSRRRPAPPTTPCCRSRPPWHPREAGAAPGAGPSAYIGRDQRPPHQMDSNRDTRLNYDLRSLRMNIRSDARRRAPALALLGAVAILAACSVGSRDTSGGTAGLPSTATVTIPQADRFEPFLPEIAAGGTVTFTNKDTYAHTVVSMPTDPVDFKLLVESGKSVKLTFSQPGIYGYYCDAHSDYDRVTGLVKAKKGASAYPISMYGIILVAGGGPPLSPREAEIVGGLPPP